MAPPDRRPVDRHHHNVQNGHHNVPNGHRNIPNGHTRQSSHQHSHPNSVDRSPPNRQVAQYQRNSLQVYPERPAARTRPSEEAEVYSPRVYQNANALEKYQTQEKHLVRQGKHAAAVDQLYENDLHNIHYSKPQQPARSAPEVLPNGMSAESPVHSDQRYIRRFLNLKVHYDDPHTRPQSVHDPHIRPQSVHDPHPRHQSVHDPPDSGSLHTSFDPMKDRHLWTMWRTAVNGRIVDEVRKLERIKSEHGSEASNNMDASNPGVYGKAIVAPPLKRFIKMDERNKETAQQFSDLGQGQLETNQFVYYGLPRVNITPTRERKH